MCDPSAYSLGYCVRASIPLKRQALRTDHVIVYPNSLFPIDRSRRYAELQAGPYKMAGSSPLPTYTIEISHRQRGLRLSGDFG